MRNKWPALEYPFFRAEFYYRSARQLVAADKTDADLQQLGYPSIIMRVRREVLGEPLSSNQIQMRL
jgi:hypothetical protein